MELTRSWTVGRNEIGTNGHSLSLSGHGGEPGGGPPKALGVKARFVNKIHMRNASCAASFHASNGSGIAHNSVSFKGLQWR